MATTTTTPTKTRIELKSINPFNGEALKTYEEMTPEEVDAAIATADEAFRAVHHSKLGGQLAAELRNPPNHGTVA